MLENAVYSILSPEGYASILWKDSSRAEEAAEKMKLTAKDLLELGVIDEVLNEPNGNAKSDINKMAEIMKKKIISLTKKLKSLDIEDLVENRYQKFRNM